MDKSDGTLDPMRDVDIDAAASLVARAMNADEGRWARRTMGFHFGCESYGLDDGRSYFVWRQEGRIAGLVGLHHTIWGPEENVWLAWFAVDPHCQGQGLGLMNRNVEIKARVDSFGPIRDRVKTLADGDPGVLEQEDTFFLCPRGRLKLRQSAGSAEAESRAHFSLWCILAAPLMAGNDVRRMSDEVRSILTDNPFNASQAASHDVVLLKLSPVK